MLASTKDEVTKFVASLGEMPPHLIDIAVKDRFKLSFYNTSPLDLKTIASVDDALHTDEILLVRDVLDTQIVDIAGQRLARVADVVLAHRRDVGLEIVGAEIGFAAVLRRLGLPQLARKLLADTVAWSSTNHE